MGSLWGHHWYVLLALTIISNWAKKACNVHSNAPAYLATLPLKRKKLCNTGNKYLVISKYFAQTFFTLTDPLKLLQMPHALPEAPFPFPFVPIKLHSPCLLKSSLSYLKCPIFNNHFILFVFNNAIHFCININAFDFINQYRTGLFVSYSLES